MGVFVLGLAWSGCNALSAVVCLTLATACHGAVSTGPLASMVDISPNFASKYAVHRPPSHTAKENVPWKSKEGWNISR